MDPKYDILRGKVLDACNKAGLTLSISPAGERTDTDEVKGTALGFTFTLTRPPTARQTGGPSEPVRFSGTYSAGVGIADRWATENLRESIKGLPLPCLGGVSRADAMLALMDAGGFNRSGFHRTTDGLKALRHCRARYRPSIVDVVSALFLDASFAQEHDTWEEMAIESGADTQSVEGLRKAQRDFLACKEAARFLARAFGPNHGTVSDYVREL